MNDTPLWQTKLAARLHDPAEKALVLLRDPAGHEDGTARVFHRDLGLDRCDDDLAPDEGTLGHVAFDRIAAAIHRTIMRADRWSAAGDRPQWPMQEVEITTRHGKENTLAVADYAQVLWTECPVIKHPLTGQAFDLRSLTGTEIGDIKERSNKHFRSLTLRNDDGRIDWQRSLLAYWRFGPELREDHRDNDPLGLLWRLLPADTRVPDQTIWDHLDLTSAFAGAFADDEQGEAALLAMGIGPVQEFIASARSTSDLWAGSHLLSRLTWETMRVICEELGPDAILFPRLRGIPQVDLWLQRDMGLPKKWFAHEEWASRETDSNPLFAGALPNRFVAAVPAGRAGELAQKARDRVREWLRDQGDLVVETLLKEIGTEDPGARAYHQMRAQLDDFPEVHWAAVPFSLIRANSGEHDAELDTTRLSEAMAPFFADKGVPGFLSTPAWEALSRAIEIDGIHFVSPNPGVLYPAVHDLADRVLAAAKAVRPFGQIEETGWRCSLTGAAERLALDDEDLATYPNKDADTLWNRVANRRRAWAKTGEHLAALPAIKRLWPTLFATEVAEALSMEKTAVPRFVVSTHTMALASQLERWLKNKSNRIDEPLATGLAQANPVPLPRRLARLAGSRDDFDTVRRLPGLLEAAAESNDEDALEQARNRVKDLLGEKPEAYYALLMMDGDRMGRILGGDPAHAITYRESLHPNVQAGFDRLADAHANIRAYGDQRRALSPGRHMAISAALNDFTLHVVPEVVEQEHAGRLLYAGGDDVLAMLPVPDLLPAMVRLRNAYSGHGEVSDWNTVSRERNLALANGFAFLRGQLMRMMGENATASAGAVIAHHQAPLNAVRRALEAAEKAAKNAGRNAFTLTVVKRSGGNLQFTANWTAMPLIEKLVAFLADPAVSRRAVYHSLHWLGSLPERPPQDMLAGLLGYQFERQYDSGMASNAHGISDLARDLAEFVLTDEHPLDRLANVLSTAEFLAREGRAGERAKQQTEQGETTDA